MQANVRWTEGMQFIGKADSGHAVVMDVASTVGGTDSALRPFELFLVALCGCSGMDVVLILKKMKIDFSGLEIQIDAVQSDVHPRRLVAAQLEYVVRGKNVTEDQVKRAVDLSLEKYCSILATLRPDVTLSSKVTILNE